jgi:hypothetical protein
MVFWLDSCQSINVDGKRAFSQFMTLSLQHPTRSASSPPCGPCLPNKVDLGGELTVKLDPIENLIKREN